MANLHTCFASLVRVRVNPNPNPYHMTRVNKPFHSENTSTLLERVPGGRGMEGGGGEEGVFTPHHTTV